MSSVFKLHLKLGSTEQFSRTTVICGNEFQTEAALTLIR